MMKKKPMNSISILAVFILLISIIVISCGGSSSKLDGLAALSALPRVLTVCADMINVQYENPELDSYGFHSISSWQGIEVIDNYIYIFGDGTTSLIQELDIDFVPTGWEGTFVEDGVDIINHPTGIAYHPGYPTFIANGTLIYSFDWDLFYRDKNLDRAIISKISTNGRLARPEYVRYNEQWYIASTGYDAEDAGNEMLLMDPTALSKALTIDDPGVIIYRFAIPNLVQDIFWDDFSNSAVLVQNIELYKGWRLTLIDIDKAITLGSGTGDAVIRTRCIFPTQEPHILISELEGYARLSSKREAFLVAHPDLNNNMFVNDMTDDQILP